jgi:hypothetical protein
MSLPSPPNDSPPPAGGGFGPPEGYGPAQGYGRPQGYGHLPGYGQGPAPADPTQQPIGYGPYAPPPPVVAGSSGPKVAAIFIAGVLTAGLVVGAFLLLLRS